MNGRWRFALVAGLSLLATLAQAQAQAPEAAVKAAFLYKFPGYIEWPPEAFPSADTPFVIGVSGADEVATELERLVPGRSIGARRIVVRRVRDGESVRGLHILFVGQGHPGARAMLRSAHSQGGVLAVSEGERGLEQGASINFVAADERVAFEVSLENAERSRLRISSRMLAVARRVIPRG